MTSELERKNREFNERKARREWIADRVRHYINKANSLYGRSMGVPLIRYHDKGRAAGRAIYTDYAVSFHSVLAAENGEAFDQTIGHEVAHLVAKRVFGCSGHGKAWKRVMKALGLRVERCHSYDMTNAKVRRQKRFEYVCACPKDNVHKIATVTHNRIQRGHSYRCGHCKMTLLPLSEFPNIATVTPHPKGGWKVYVRNVNGYFFAEDDEVLKAQLPVLDRKGK